MKNSKLKIAMVGRVTPCAPLRRVQFANSTAKAEFVELANELAFESDGWAQLAPFGDFPGKAVLANADGTVTTFDAVQRLDRAAADAMVANFYSVGNRIKRFIKGCSIFNGHPDMPDAGDRYPDRSAKGLIVELQTRDNGLYCKPAFNNDGEALLNGPKKLFFSGRWTSDELPEENGRRVFRPDQLKSAGLTPRPNLPVQHLNEKPQPQPQQNPMNKKLILDLLAAFGVTFANDAADDQIASEIKKLGDKAKTADTLTQEKTQLANEKAGLAADITGLQSQIANQKSEITAVRTSFANERNARITGLLDDATSSGRITAAERPDWERRLKDETQFANEASAITRLEKKVKTATILTIGDRKVEIANAGQRRDAVQTLVNIEMANSKCDYDTAYRAVAKANPVLFEAMQQPKS